MGKRPDYAVVVYCNLIRQVYKHTPVIIGGIEASLRRLAHYDYWSDTLKRSILLDSGADLISYGMGERSIAAIAEALDAGLSIRDLTYIDGTVCKVRDLSSVYDPVILPSYEDLKRDRLNYAKSFYTQYCNTDPFSGRRLVEPYSGSLLCGPESAIQTPQPGGDGPGIQLSIHAYLASRPTQEAGESRPSRKSSSPLSATGDALEAAVSVP